MISYVIRDSMYRCAVAYERTPTYIKFLLQGGNRICFQRGERARMEAERAELLMLFSALVVPQTGAYTAKGVKLTINAHKILSTPRNMFCVHARARARVYQGHFSPT